MMGQSKLLRLIVAIHAIWIGIILVLGVWWGALLIRQRDTIAQLQQELGVSLELVTQQNTQFHRMILWESTMFFALLVISSAFLFWIYWRESDRRRSFSAFFASVTHELRTPLTSIRLQAESIAEKIPADSPQARLAARLLEDTSRLESQVERTLELARVEGGGPVLNQAVRLKPWADRILNSWSETYAKRLEIDSKLDDKTANADPSALQVILKNLLENSLRHGRKERIHVQLQAEERGPWVVIDYKDNGVGFEGDPRHLGELFYKGEHSQGAGVGLYLVSALMKRMGGRAEFHPGSGFGASLWLPKGESHV